MGKHRERGFTLLEMMVVVAILLVVMALAAPKMLQISDNAKLQASAQAYAGLLQTARTRAVNDNAAYQVLTTTYNGVPMAYVDLTGNQTYVSGGSNPDPAVQLANPIVITDTGAPTTGFNSTTLLNIIPLTLETSTMVDVNGNASPGLAFNERGLPCQRTTASGACKNSTVVSGNTTLVAWVTYLRYTRRTGGYAWAAVTVTPAGRIKTWSYQNTSSSAGSWQ
jgi:prepilin-type N-terminal cleavage/methylation domain-containing protein